MSSLAGSTDIDESSGVTEDESYDDVYVGCNYEENGEDGDLDDDNDGDDGGDDVSLQGLLQLKQTRFHRYGTRVVGVAFQLILR